MGKFGYDFYFKIGNEVLTLPITPASFKMTVGSNNKVVTLINEGDINILKSPSLAEFEFEARFPMRKYPYSRDPLNFETYLNKFTALKTEKTPFVLNVIRTTPDGRGTWATVRRVTLENLEVNESADEGDDVIVSFSLKEYKEYGVVTHKSSDAPDTTSTSATPRTNDNKSAKATQYTVREGDTLWAIAKAAYDNGSKWTAIYEANKNIIESTAEQRRGKGKGSENGHWIYPGTNLVIPGITDPVVVSAKKSPSSSGGSSSGSSSSAVPYKPVSLTVTFKNPDNLVSHRIGTAEINYYYQGKYRTETVFTGSKTLTVDKNRLVMVKVTSPSGKVGEVYTKGWKQQYTKNSKTYFYTITSIQSPAELILSWK